MSKRFHVNTQTGSHGPCSAGQGANARGCPFGGDSGEENHYDNMRDAKSASEVFLSNKYGSLSSANKKQSTTTKTTNSSAPVVANFNLATEEESARNGFVVPTKDANGEDYGNGWIGSNRAKHSNLTTKDIHGYIKDDLAKAVKSGYLPKNLKYRTIKSRDSIDIEIISNARHRDMIDYDTSHGYTREILKPSHQEVLDRVQAIHDSYNYDTSRIEVDYHNVGYYGTTHFAREHEVNARTVDAAERKLERVQKAESENSKTWQEAILSPKVMEAQNALLNAHEKYDKTHRSVRETVNEIDLNDGNVSRIDWVKVDRVADEYASERREQRLNTLQRRLDILNY